MASENNAATPTTTTSPPLPPTPATTQQIHPLAATRTTNAAENNGATVTRTTATTIATSPPSTTPTHPLTATIPTASEEEGENDTTSITSFASSSRSTSPLPSPPRSSPPSPTPTPSTEDRRQTLTCSLCLDIYRQPKLLPCCHTYCQHCLEKLLAHSRTATATTFACPNCRRAVAIPRSGARAFQNNFYLLPEDLAKARDGTHCLSHPQQDLDLFCVDCQRPVCLKCKLTRHETHSMQELTDACLQARSQLKDDRQRLQESVTCMIEQVDTARKEQQAQQDKRTAMESIIRKQHGTLVAAAEKFLVEALATLKTASEEVEDTLHQQVSSRKHDLQDLCKLQEDLGQVLNTENRYKLLAAVKEMREGRGSPQALASIVSGSQEVCRSDLQPDFILSHFRQFLSTVSAVEAELKSCSELSIQNGVFNVKHIRVAVSVEKQFRCGKRYDCEVFCVCPMEDGTVWISYLKNGPSERPPAEKYDSEGKLLCTSEKMAGKVSFKCIGTAKVRYLLPVGADGSCSRAFCKWGSKVHYKLGPSVNGRACITRVEVVTEEPFNAQLSQVACIQVGPHRGFDIDCNGEFFVVLEEPLPPHTKRKVKMYRLKEEEPAGTYTPPTPTFQASDVSFCRLGGDAAVLVADELGDSIHVLAVKDGAMSFLRYLAPGAPSLLHPTALNVDTKGRLWVACRGGQLLTMFPVT